MREGMGMTQTSWLKLTDLLLLRVGSGLSVSLDIRLVGGSWIDLERGPSASCGSTSDDDDDEEEEEVDTVQDPSLCSSS